MLLLNKKMEVSVGGLGDLGDLPPIDVGDTPQQVGTTSERFLPVAVRGAGRIADSRPRDALEEGGSEDNGGSEGVGDEEDGEGKAMEGGVEMVEGAGGKMRWTKEEKVMVWECFAMTGGVRRENYIERTTDLYNERSQRQRNKNSVFSQIRGIGFGGLTMMERGEIEKRVRAAKEEEERVMAEGRAMFEDSNGEEEGFWGFEDEEWEEGQVENRGEGVDGQVAVEARENDERMEEADEVVSDQEGRQEVDFVVEMPDERRVDADPRVVMEARVDSWTEADGSVRCLKEDEKKVLAMLRDVQKGDKWENVPNLRAAERKRVRAEVELVDGLMHNLIRPNMDVSGINRLLYAAGVVVAKRLGLRFGNSKKAEERKPWWQRRIEGNIVRWRKDLARVEEIRKGSKVRDKVKSELEKRYQMTDRGALAVSGFLKNKIHAGSVKIRWYVEKRVARRQNNLFQNNQRQLYKELGGDAKGRTNDIPDAAESREFWGNIWSAEIEHDRDASWLNDIKEMFADVAAQEDVTIEMDDVRKGIRRMANWKAPGPDGVRGFWFKRLPSLHSVLRDALQVCVNRGEVPAWMVKGRTVMIQKDPAKGTAVSNYRPIACLPLLWKLLTGIFAGKIYDHLQVNNLLPDEQKGCRRKSRGTKDQLLIDKAVLREARAKQRYLSMAWIDYRKAYDMLPHSWILETLELIKVANNIDSLLRGSMKDWKTELTAGGTSLGEVTIRRGIFQGDSLSPLLFVVAMIPLTLLLRREKLGYQFGPEGRRTSHLLFMDDLKLYAKDREELGKLLEVVRVYSRDIRMEFGLDKCAVLEIRAGVKGDWDGFELPDGQMIKEVDENGYKYLGVLEGASIKTKQMKELIRKEYLRRVRLAARSRLYAGNLISAVNVWAVSVVRYTAGVLDWSAGEVKKMDRKTRKLLTMNGAFNMQSSVDRLYIKRKAGGRGLISVEECVRTEEASLREYARDSDEWMLKVVADGMVPGESKVDYKVRMERERLERLKTKTLHGKFFNETEQVADERSWQWLRGGFLDKRTEAFVCAAQENALKTRCYNATILHQEGDVKCRMCGKSAETVGHVMSACDKLAQRDYKRRHDRMGLRIYWELCGKYGIKRTERWFEETPDAIRVNNDGRYEIWWDKKVITAKVLEHNRPDVVVIDREKKRWTMVDFSVPFDANVVAKELEKTRKYEQLATEVTREHRVTTAVIPIVVGALGTVSRNLAGGLKRLGIGDVLGGLQMSAIIGTSAILRKVLCTNA